MKKLLATLALLLLAAPALATHTPATYTIGAGGDYATIAAFLTAHPNGTGHTLTILPGTVTGMASSAYLPPNTVIQGQTDDESLYVITPSATTNVCCASTDSALVIQNVTLRSIPSFAGYAVECEGNGLGTANVGNLTLKNCRFDDFDTTSSQIIHGNDFLRRWYKDCYFAHCDAATVGAIDNNPFEAGTDIIVDGCVFYENISTAYPVFSWAITDTLCTAADSIVIKNSLFVNNRRSTILANANFVNDVDATQRPSITLLADHNTFYGNETPGGTAANKGQLVINNTDGFATSLVTNCIFAASDSTYALHSATIDSVTHTAAWGCAGSNAIDGVAFADTIMGKNPLFNDIFTPTSGHFQARRTGMADCKGTCYMGWEPWPGAEIDAIPTDDDGLGVPFRRDRHRG